VFQKCHGSLACWIEIDNFALFANLRNVCPPPDISASKWRLIVPGASRNRLLRLRGASMLDVVAAVAQDVKRCGPFCSHWPRRLLWMRLCRISPRTDGPTRTRLLCHDHFDLSHSDD
jgi:hypothetical protein